MIFRKKSRKKQIQSEPDSVQDNSANKSNNRHQQNLNTELSGAFFAHAPDPMLIIAFNGDIVAGNDKACDLLGYSTSELQNLHIKDISEFIHKNGLFNFRDKVKQEGETILEDTLIKKSGASILVESHIRAASIDNKKYAWTSIRDISDYKATINQQEDNIKELEFLNQFSQKLIYLKASSEIYELLSEYIHKLLPESIVTLSVFDSRNEKISIKNIKGIKNSLELLIKVLQKSPLDMSFEATEENARKMLTQRLVKMSDSLYELARITLSEKVTKKVEKIINFGSAYGMGITKGSNLFGTVVILIPANSGIRNQELIETLVSQAAVALQKTQLDDKLRRNEGLLSRTERVSHLGTWELNLKTNVLKWSDELYRILGFTPQSFRPQVESMINLIHKDDIEFVSQQFEKAAKNKDNFSAEYRIIRQDKQIRRMMTTAEIIYDNDDKPYYLSGLSIDITEQRKSEVKIKEASDKYNSLINNANEGIFVIQDDHFKFVNPVGLELSGYSFEELSAMRFQDILYPDDIELVAKRNKARLMGEDFSPYDIRFITKKGEEVWINLNATFMQWDSKPAVLCFASDISERKKTEKELQKSQHELNQLFATADDMIYLQDTEGNIKMLNNYIERLGFKHSKNITLHDWKKQLHKDDIEKVDRFFRNHSGKVNRYRGEYRMLDASGQWRWFDAKMIARKDEHDNIIGYYCIDRDITYLKNTERALQKAKQRAEKSSRKNQGLLEAMPDMMFVFDRNGVILDSHSGKDSLYYKPKSSFLNKNIQDVLPQDLASLTLKKITKVIQSGKSDIYKYKLVIQNIENVYESRMVLLDDHHVLSIVRDITERERMMEELKMAKEKAEESDKLKSAFLATMSHELRTPLNAIIGFSGLIINNDYPGKEIEYSHIVHNNGKHLLEVINSILNISSIEAGDIRLHEAEFDAAELAETVFSVLQAELEARNKTMIQARFNPPRRDQPIIAYSDQTKIRQILVNLISNAVKFTNHGYIEIGYTTDNEDLIFTVSDTGIGIDKQDQKKIFEQFRQLDDTHTRSTDGVGLGLSVCQKLADLLSADISVQSELDKGTTFELRLSYVLNQFSEESQAAESKKTDYEIDEQAIRNKTILIAEDEESNFMLLKAILQRFKCIILHAKNGQEAISMVQNNANIDLIFMDIKMPVKNGYEATKEIKATHPSIPVIALTAYAMRGDREKAYDSGCDEYLAKPLNKDQLIELVKQYC